MTYDIRVLAGRRDQVIVIIEAPAVSSTKLHDASRLWTAKAHLGEAASGAQPNHLRDLSIGTVILELEFNNVCSIWYILCGI